MNKINATHFEEIPAFPEGADDFVVHAVIETPRDIRHKYEFQPEYGIIKLKQTIPEGLEWPYDFGFVPQTLGADGDPLDILFLGDAPTFPGCLVEGRLLGIINLQKNGEENDRLVACAQRIQGVALSTDAYDTIHDVPQSSVRSLCRFLVDYSEEEGNKIKFRGVQSRKKALQAIHAGLKSFRRARRGR